MIRRFALRPISIALAALVVLVPLSAAAVAQTEEGTGSGSTNSSFSATNTNSANTNGANTNTANTNTANTNSGNTNSTNTNRGLEAAKLRVCQNREAAINRILSRMSDRAQRQLDVFTIIAQRVQVFYATKGRSLTNYDVLVTDANAKKAAADSQVTALRSAVTFSCTVDNPKGLAQTFKDKLRTANAALKDYRTAVKNLIAGVKSVQGQASSNGNANASASNANG